MHHVFCLSSPFQADSARRAVEFLKIDSDHVTILLFDKAFGRDVERVRHSLGWLWEEAEIRKINFKTNTLPRRVSFFANYSPSEEFKIYVGDWRNKLPKIFGLHPRFKGFYALDDGLASFVIAEQVQRRSIYYNLFSRFRPHFLSRYPLRQFCPSLPVTLMPAEHLTLEYSNDVLFVGCSLVENDIVDEAEYRDLLDRVESRFEGSRIFYYPHRSEKGKALPPQFEEIENSLPIESWYRSLNPAPGRVVSFYSSALFNLKSDHPEIDAFYVRLNDQSIVNRKRDIRFVYKALDRLDDFNELLV